MSYKILLLSGYDAYSHRHWHSILTSMFPGFRWTILTQPARHFSWRVRASALEWGFGRHDALTEHYDLLIATSMVDLSSLRGLRPTLSGLPTLYYFHENQFAYPLGTDASGYGEATRLEATIVSLYGALCADRIAFNSGFNRDTFLTGLASLLKRLPDSVPEGVLEKLQGAAVVPVPLALDLRKYLRGDRPGEEPLAVAWNHRWEYDKGPALLLSIVQAACERELPLRFHIMGQAFRNRPPEFEQIDALLRTHGARTGIAHQVGAIENRDDYLRALAGCDVVLSTARHDFQGLSILEGAALGCTPLCPDDLVYPEYLDAGFLYCRTGLTDDETALAAIERLAAWSGMKAGGAALPRQDTARFESTVLKESYLTLMKESIDARVSFDQRSSNY